MDYLNSHHQTSISTKRRLIIATVIVLCFSAAELIGGLWSGSLTLLSDAGHTAADSINLCLAAFAAWITSRPRSKRHTYGFGRAEVITAWISSLILFAVAITILLEAIHRFKTPHEVTGGIVMVIAIIGFAVNLVLALLLSHRSCEKNLTTKGALLHIFGDLFGIATVLISGVIIKFTGWKLVDPILSIVICLLIIFSTINLLRESITILMESVPKDIDIHDVEAAMTGVYGVDAVHDTHVWTLTSGMVLLTAHVVIKNLNSWPRILWEIHQILGKNFSINHATLQPERSDMQ
jgi:cobalt-zinc-cadmium efflux system protein